MQLPISAAIGIAIAVMAVVAIVAFVVTTGGGAARQAEMQKQFAEGCLVICSMEQRTDAPAVRLAYAGFEEWQSACEQIHAVDRGAYLQCLEKCACGSLPTLCERLQRAARDVAANCPFLCTAALEHNATRLLYQGCDCLSACT